MSIFLDANILFSGSNPTSHLRRFLFWVSDFETLVTSPYAAQEASRNIAIKRIQWQQTYGLLMQKLLLVPDASLHLDSKLPDKDKPILGAAIEAQCAYLLTGDKRDFAHLYGRQVGGVTVIDVLSLAQVMLDKHHDGSASSSP